MDWTRMIDRLPPLDEQFLLSVPWKGGLSLVWRTIRNDEDLIFNHDGLSVSETERYRRPDCLWAVPDKPEGVV